MKKRILLMVPVAILLATFAIGAGSVFAKDQSTITFPPIIQKIIDKFNLNSDEVRKLIDEERQNQMAKRTTNFEERLTRAIADGKITEAQKTLILAKKVEMEQKMKDLQGLTKEERKTKSKEYMQELKTWANSNGIKLNFIGGIGWNFNKGPKDK